MIAMQWNSSYQESIPLVPPTTTSTRSEGGSQMSGFPLGALGSRTLNQSTRAITACSRDKRTNLSGRGRARGAEKKTAVISVTLVTPSRGPDKDASSETRAWPARRVESSNSGPASSRGEPSEAKAVIMKSLQRSRARDGREQGTRPDPRKSALRELDACRGKLADCLSQGPLARRAVVARATPPEARPQAGPRPQNTVRDWPLEAKILNVEKSRIDNGWTAETPRFQGHMITADRHTACATSHPENARYNKGRSDDGNGGHVDGATSARSC